MMDFSPNGSRFTYVQKLTNPLATIIEPILLDKAINDNEKMMAAAVAGKIYGQFHERAQSSQRDLRNLDKGRTYDYLKNENDTFNTLMSKLSEPFDDAFKALSAQNVNLNNAMLEQVKDLIIHQLGKDFKIAKGVAVE